MALIMIHHVGAASPGIFGSLPKMPAKSHTARAESSGESAAIKSCGGAAEISLSRAKCRCRPLLPFHEPKLAEFTLQRCLDSHAGTELSRTYCRFLDEARASLLSSAAESMRPVVTTSPEPAWGDLHQTNFTVELT